MGLTSSSIPCWVWLSAAACRQIFREQEGVQTLLSVLQAMPGDSAVVKSGFDLLKNVSFKDGGCSHSCACPLSVAFRCS